MKTDHESFHLLRPISSHATTAMEPSTDRLAYVRNRWAIIGSFVFMCLFLPVRVMELSNKHSGDVIYRWVVTPGDNLIYRYIHSVEKTPVEAWFSIEADNRLQLKETRFPSYGAGLPNATGERKTASGWITLASNCYMESFSTYFSSVNHPSIRIKSKKWRIARPFQDGDILKLSAAHRMLGRIIPTILSTRIHADSSSDVE